MIPPASSTSTGEMISSPKGLTVNLSDGRASPVGVVQATLPGGKLRTTEQVRVAVVLLRKMVGWIEMATGDPTKVCAREMEIR